MLPDYFPTGGNSLIIVENGLERKKILYFSPLEHVEDLARRVKTEQRANEWKKCGYPGMAGIVIFTIPLLFSLILLCLFFFIALMTICCLAVKISIFIHSVWCPN